MTVIRPRDTTFLANLNPTLGAEISNMRPVVIVSRDERNRYLQTVTVCPSDHATSSPLEGSAANRLRWKIS